MSDKAITPIANSQELRAKFLAIKTPGQLARFLKIRQKSLIDLICATPDEVLYREYGVPKRSGGMRRILEPNDELKEVQSRLNRLLQAVYYPKRKLSAQGFLTGRSIITNAGLHKDRKHVLNVDLENFFPSITFNRVRGMFMGKVYELPEEVADVLAHICCFQNQLPQGAPTSPIISNMLCAQMDSQLQRLAQSQRCIYTRYADDMTFSTYTTRFPIAVATTELDGTVKVGNRLLAVITENGFSVNSAKVRLQTSPWRQMVTGLIVNEFPNVDRNDVRAVRAMLHNWGKQGYEKAQDEFCKRYDPRHRIARRNSKLFAQVVQGRIEFIGMVKGKNNPIYIRFLKQLTALEPKPSKSNMERLLETIAKAEAALESQAAEKGIRPGKRQTAEMGSPEWHISGLESMEWLLKEKQRQAIEAARSSTNLQDKQSFPRRKWDVDLNDYRTLESRLKENIYDKTKYGDSETLRSDRARIIEALNKLASDALGVTFNDLADGELPG